MNDSIFFLRRIEDIFSKICSLIDENYQFIGINRADSHKIHYQSYFWVFSNEVLNEFKDYLEDDILTISKNDLIKKYEVGLSNMLINKYKSISIYNIQQWLYYPEKIVKLIDQYNFPIIKIKTSKNVNRYKTYLNKMK